MYDYLKEKRAVLVIWMRPLASVNAEIDKAAGKRSH